MSEGPCVVMVLRGEYAIDRWRALMGATDPGQAGEGTIRKDFGQNIERNAVHGSDSPESANFRDRLLLQRSGTLRVGPPCSKTWEKS